jgi:hypothetical protein
LITSGKVAFEGVDTSSPFFSSLSAAEGGPEGRLAVNDRERIHGRGDVLVMRSPSVR